MTNDQMQELFVFQNRPITTLYIIVAVFSFCAFSVQEQISYWKGLLSQG